MINRIKSVGPGALVAAAFIGPGTVTACTVAGAQFGYALLWALVFATIATIILQEMSARLGVVTQKGLGENLSQILNQSVWKWPMAALIGLALYVGNAAYEAGNLAGAALGIEAVTGSQAAFKISVIICSSVAAIILLIGSYKLIEKILISLVLLMAIAFIATFAIAKPDFAALSRGLIIPSISGGSLMTIIALIGTTVVPYNLFLHASAVSQRWNKVDDLPTARSDTVIAIGLGGLITILIVSTAAASMFTAGLTVSNASDMARQMEPLFGPSARYVLGIGLFAAGLSSSITAPLATAYAMTEILGLKSNHSDRTKSLWFRLIMLSVIAVGAGLALTGIKPITIILAAQFANGLLLPIIASFLLFAMNQENLLGRYVNGIFSNALGTGVIIITIGLGVRLVLRSLSIL